MDVETNEEIVAVARTCTDRDGFQRQHPRLWRLAYRRRLLSEIYLFLPKKTKHAYSDSELIADAARFSNRVAWKKAGLEDRAKGVASRYHAARKRGTEVMAKCTAHMSRSPLNEEAMRAHTDTALRASASKFKTLSAWKRGHYAAYLSAIYQRTQKGRADFWQSITAHMDPASNPYGGSYFVYACLFHQNKRAYVGLSCRAEHVRRGEHTIRGPVFNYMEATGHGFEFVVLQRDYPNPKEVIAGEERWHTQYEAAGWAMLNDARCGSLGTLAIRLSKDMLHQRALDFNTLGDFAKHDQSAHRLAKEYGWFEEITSHMESLGSVRTRTRTGEKRTDAAKAKMRAAKLGTTLPDTHKSAIAASTKASWDDPEIRARRAAGMAQVEMGRPKGWRLTVAEARHLGLNLAPELTVNSPYVAAKLDATSVGLVELTEDQKKSLRRYRYKADAALRNAAKTIVGLQVGAALVAACTPMYLDFAPSGSDSP